MANFFKEYQAQVRQRKQAFEDRQRKERDRETDFIDYIDGLCKGDKVKVNKAYSYNGYMFYCSRFSQDRVILSESKSEAKTGQGYLYSINVIIK